MKIYISIFIVCIFAVTTNAEISQVPDQTLLSTSIETIHALDSFIVSASEGGVSLFVYDSSSEVYSFITREYISQFRSIVSSKLSDSILVISTQDEKLHFVSLRNLPELSYLGFVDLNRSFADFVLIDSFLYIAGFFDGILRYELQNFNNALFVDSSMTGILVTQLENDDNYLYALDEYNGILKYELNDFDFGTFIDYLFVPFRANAFTKTDSLFYLHLIKGGLLVGDFNEPAGDNIVDSIFDLNQVEFMYVTDSLLIVADNREITLINQSDYSDKSVFTLQGVNPEGIISSFHTNLTMIFPNLNGGMLFVSFDTSLIIENGLAYNGKIIDVLIENSVLYVSSDLEPVQLFTIDSSGVISYRNSLYEELNETGQLAHNGDSLFVQYPELERFAIIVNADDSDFAFFENSITISPSLLREMYYTGEQLYDNALVFLEYPFGFDLYTISDSGFISYATDWNFIADITSFSFKDSIAVVTNGKNAFEAYQINLDYSRSQGPIFSFGLGGKVTESIFNNNILYLFQDHEMYIIDFSDRENIFVDTVVSIPLQVYNAKIIENYMFTVGNEGITKFDVSSQIPEVIETGGLPGDFISVDSNVIVVHDNKSIMVYYHELLLTGQIVNEEENNIIDLAQNYPNPFNLETVIRYNLAQKSEIKITVYNIMGQKVKTLINSVKEAGSYSVTWDGTNRSGDIIASGMYLYRLETTNSVVTKKMILLK